ncbi:MAG: hypothetical protein ACLP07_13685 [Terracidiphilus sp.]
MTLRLVLLFALLPMAVAVHAQNEAAPQKAPHFQLYGGYAFVSNSPNGLPGEHQPMNGWNAALGTPLWQFIRFKVDISSYKGTNQGAQEDVYYILGGPQFTRRLGRETVFVEALIGDGGINRYWGPQASPGETASFATVVGGGLDTPIARRLAFQVSGGYQWSNFQLINNVQSIEPIQTPGLPDKFARISSGLLWSF